MGYKNPEDKKKYNKEYNAMHTEQRQDYDRRRYAEKKEEILRKKRERYHANKEKHLETMRKYAQTHKEERKVYEDANREMIKDRDNAYYKNKMETDPIYKIKRNLRSRVAKALKGIGSKSDTTMNLIGCTVEELKAHIESQFVEGMSWSNYGHDIWHIDHIKPCASFDLTDPEEQKACFNWENMQPLWAIDNLSKGSSY